jgi:REP element-mobilizing transposase RayT
VDPRVLHRSREGFSRPLPCHVTLKLREGVPSLRSVRLVRELERSFAKGRERKGFRLVHYSIQGDHAHFLVEASSREALGRGMKSLGSRLARAVNRVFGRRGRVLRDRYHLRVLRSPKEVRSALAYVLLNARKHAKRLGRELTIDPASSGRWFEGWRQRLPRNAGPPVVARARTWLLCKGWRRYGLIDALEVPG